MINRGVQTMITSSIRRQLIFFFIIIMLIPSLFINAFLQDITTKILTERKANDFLYTLSRAQNDVDILLKNAEYQLTALAVEIEEMNTLSTVPQTLDNDSKQALLMEESNTIWTNIKRIQKYNPNIEAIYLYLYNYNIIINSSETRRVLKINNREKYEWINISTEDVEWEQVVTYISDYSDSMRVFLLKKEVEHIGQIALLINERLIHDNFLENYRSEERVRTLLLNEKGIVLSDLEQSNIGKNIKDKKYIKDVLKGTSGYYVDIVDDRKMLIAYTTSRNTNWKYVSMIPIDEIAIDKGFVWSRTIFINIISIILAIVLAIIFSQNMYKPIIELKNAMETAGKGDLSVQIQTKRKDEFNTLFTGFNQMIVKITKLMKALYQEKIFHKEAELKNLQAQINPHFLYNTLDSIHWMARLNKLEEVSTLTFSLSNFYKLRLGGGKKYTTIGETLELVKEFLNIMMIRYGERFDISIDVEEELIKKKILHLLIQPIVENAIYHGIEKKAEANYIGINIYKKKDEILIEIKDNGMGMEKEQLDLIQQRLQLNGTEEMQQSYSALVNIQQRIKLHYGKQYGIQIDSRYEKGTMVRIILPQNREE